MQVSSCDFFQGLGHWESTDAVPSQLLLKARNRLLSENFLWSMAIDADDSPELDFLFYQLYKLKCPKVGVL